MEGRQGAERGGAGVFTGAVRGFLDGDGDGDVDGDAFDDGEDALGTDKDDLLNCGNIR